MLALTTTFQLGSVEQTLTVQWHRDGNDSIDPTIGYGQSWWMPYGQTQYQLLNAAARSTQQSAQIRVPWADRIYKTPMGWLSVDGQQLSSYEPPGGAFRCHTFPFGYLQPVPLGGVPGVCSHGTPGSSGRPVDVVASVLRKSMGLVVL